MVLKTWVFKFQAEGLTKWPDTLYDYPQTNKPLLFPVAEALRFLKTSPKN